LVARYHGGTELITAVTIDPRTNGGVPGGGVREGRFRWTQNGARPGVAAGAEGDLPVDIEIRYALGQDESGIYTYCIFTHRPEYPDAVMTEARFAAKLAGDVRLDDGRPAARQVFPRGVEGR
jgi:rhamnogalacturonan endolyase